MDDFIMDDLDVKTRMAGCKKGMNGLLNGWMIRMRAISLPGI